MLTPADWLFRLLLLTYPSEVRRQDGVEIRRTLRERCAATRRSRGTLAMLARYPRELAGLVAAGIALRRPAPPHPVTDYPRLPAKGIAHTMDTLRQDLRYAVRSLLKSPGFTAVAALAIALGIGANTAIFSVVNAVILQPLPFPEPERLVSIWEENPERGWVEAQVAAANYLDWKERATSFEAMGAHNDWLVDLPMTSGGEPEMVNGNEVTGDLFHVLGVEPHIGSPFEPEDSWAGGEPKVILSHAFWQSRFGGDPDVVGRRLTLAGVPRTVVGVMPAGFVYPLVLGSSGDVARDIDVWVPTAWPFESLERVSFRRAHGMRVVGRLAEGVAPEAAEAELARIAADLQIEYPQTNEQMGTGITPLHDWVVGDSDRPLLIMLAAVGFVLLIACANVANMMLARASTRRGEMAIRDALGAGRWRLLRQGLTESLLLSIGGGAAGIAAGIWGINGLLALSPDGLPRLDEVGFDANLLAFATAATVLTGIVFGALPAWRASHPGSGGARRAFAGIGARGSSPDRGARNTGRLLVVAEVALALPLVVGAGLMFRTLSLLQDVEPGFDASSTLVAEISLPASTYAEAEHVAGFWAELQQALGSIPGVESAALSSRLPFRNQRWSSDFTAEGWDENRYGVGVRHDEVSPDFFETMRIPILRGRAIDETDVGEPLVVVINQALADRYFAGEDPIGKRVTFDRVPGENSFWREIIGVAGNVRRDSLAAEEEPSFYAPVLQDPTRGMHALLRTGGDPRGVADLLRARLRQIDADLPVVGITTLAEVHRGAMARERFLLTLLGVFAAVGLGLAALGIYGVISYATSQRTREIGVRVALGARAGDVLRLIIAGGMVPVLAGIAIGAAAAVAITRLMSTLLFGVQPGDPLTLAAVAALLLIVAVLACAVPARRALRVDTATALRSQ